MDGDYFTQDTAVFKRPNSRGVLMLPKNSQDSGLPRGISRVGSRTTKGDRKVEFDLSKNN